MRQRPHLHPHYQSLGLALALALCVAACGGGAGGSSTESATPLTIVVNAPFTGAPSVADAIANGVDLAVQARTQGGVLTAGGQRYRIKVSKLDDELSPLQALRNVRTAIDRHALAVVDEGTGADASWSVANAANLPIGIVYQGGEDLVDPVKRPNVFRIAPTDRGLAFRLGEYVAPKHHKVAFLVDDTAYGSQGREALDNAWAFDPRQVVDHIVLPSGQTDLSPQMLRAQRAGADALIVWARGPAIASVLSAARSRGWDVPVYTTPAGQDPIVRQQLADHPQWVDGLTFASGRMTAEEGPGPFEQFQQSYQSAFGPDLVGVKTKDGSAVTQPPEFAMYAYDMTQAILAALQTAGGADDRAKYVRTLGATTVEGANGDARSFNRRNHEGVIDDDVAFSRFHDMTFAPVADDPLSASLPAITQTQ
ncbi:MAG TPA: ABC transporter substrate-binding protein [Gaiellaceae bacterium]|nr:ABC transporter substrate-binding protein [Gaiellaceae bacterium]